MFERRLRRRNRVRIRAPCFAGALRAISEGRGKAPLRVFLGGGFGGGRSPSIPSPFRYDRRRRLRPGQSRQCGEGLRPARHGRRRDRGPERGRGRGGGGAARRWRLPGRDGQPRRARPSRSAPRLPRRRPALPRHLPGLPAPVHRERGVRPVQGARRDPRGGAPLSRRAQDPAHGMEPGRASGRPGALRRHPERRALLLRALLLPGDGRRLAGRRLVHVRRVVSGGHRTRRALRDPVPSREEPALGLQLLENFAAFVRARRS